MNKKQEGNETQVTEFRKKVKDKITSEIKTKFHGAQRRIDLNINVLNKYKKTTKKNKNEIKKEVKRIKNKVVDMQYRQRSNICIIKVSKEEKHGNRINI